MKRFAGIMAVVVCVAVLLPGCQLVASPLAGGLYTDVQAPYTATSNDVGAKVGTSEADTILGWVARGDCSINEAASSVGISSISHIDFHAYQIWFIYARFETYVYGD